MGNKRLIKILFGIPNEGGTDASAYDNRMEMCFHLGTLQCMSHFGFNEYDGAKYQIPDGVEYQFSIASVGEVFTALARERLAEYAVDGGFDYLFMVDDDMLVPKDMFERLIAHDVDIIAPLAFTRNAPHKPVIYNLLEGYDAIAKSDYYINYSVVNYPKDQLVQCDAVGFGSVLINVRVLKGMKKPYFMTTSGAGEDIHFCHKAGQAGFKIFMDTSVKLGHLGYRKEITEETYESENNVPQLREMYGDERKYY
jgi:GT2 family glycosyltransferase